ncbi:MAG TPA: hypothetical protein VFB08_03710 [Burkholderiales bacterium]|nr:hypothetical protein [Burkholderiales bacterium]
MPAYPWICHVCGGAAAGGTEACAKCGAPAVLSPNEVEERKRRREGRAPVDRRWNPRRTGLVFLGAYLGVIALCLVFIALSSGDMAGLVLILPSLPWPIVGALLYKGDGAGIGMAAGLVLNGFIAYFAGRLAARLRNR